MCVVGIAVSCIGCQHQNDNAKLIQKNAKAIQKNTDGVIQLRNKQEALEKNQAGHNRQFREQIAQQKEFNRQFGYERQSAIPEKIPSVYVGFRHKGRDCWTMDEPLLMIERRARAANIELERLQRNMDCMNGGGKPVSAPSPSVPVPPTSPNPASGK